MALHGVDALFLSGSIDLFYFSGIKAPAHDRLFALFLPREGEPVCICPRIELDNVLERMVYGQKDIQTWEEYEAEINAAWAAEKLTPGTVTDTLNKSGIAEKVNHKKIIIPGLVAVLSGGNIEWEGLVELLGGATFPAYSAKTAGAL